MLRAWAECPRGGSTAGRGRGQRGEGVLQRGHFDGLHVRLQLLQGRDGAPLQTLETEGQMLQRVMPELMGMKNILAINDEAHHCYRQKPNALDDEDLKGDDRKEAEQNNEAARLWISGLEAVGRKLGLARVPC